MRSSSGAAALLLLILYWHFQRMRGVIGHRAATGLEQAAHMEGRPLCNGERPQAQHIPVRVWSAAAREAVTAPPRQARPLSHGITSEQPRRDGDAARHGKASVRSDVCDTAVFAAEPRNVFPQQRTHPRDERCRARTIRALTDRQTDGRACRLSIRTQSHEAHAVRSTAAAAAAAAAYARDDHAVLERDLREVWPAERRAASRADQAV